MHQDHSQMPSEAEWASALFDDECDLTDEQLKSLTRDPSVAARYAEFAIISDALHPGGSQQVSSGFQLRVMDAIAREPIHFLPAHQREVRQRRRLVSALAAGVGAVGFVSAAYFVALPGLESFDAPVAMQSPVQNPSQAGVQTVRVQSPWQDPQARKFIDAHGPTVVKMRLESEQP
ncbi:MAG: Anti sigma-E protein RseA, N-terminal domain [Pseudomonadota bacterium]|jgi:negative regulator of sigma E activity